MDIFSNLFYNPLMRKFLLILTGIVLLGVNCSEAASLKLQGKKQPTKVIQSEKYMNISNQANVFYAENDISFNCENDITFSYQPLVQMNGTQQGVVCSPNLNSIQKLTQAQYDALSSKDANTIYIIVG